MYDGILNFVILSNGTLLILKKGHRMRLSSYPAMKALTLYSITEWRATGTYGILSQETVAISEMIAIENDLEAIAIIYWDDNWHSKLKLYATSVDITFISASVNICKIDDPRAAVEIVAISV